MPVELQLGKLPAQPARPQLRAARFLDSSLLPAPHEHVDWLDPVPEWPMYGNDRYGDCVFAGIGHQEQQISLLGQGREVRVSLESVLAGYSQVTGFDPTRPETDQGTYVIDAMQWWRKTGIEGHQILAFASIDPDDITLIKQCIRLFGAVGIGFNFPRSAWSQFDSGQVWDIVSGSPVEGGHYVMVGAYDGDTIDNITWGRRQGMTYRFWSKYVDEVWLVIDDEMANILTGLTSAGVDLYTLGQYFTGLTGEPSPIPAPPEPARETATPADRALWADPKFRDWASKDRTPYRKARAAARAHRDAKGLG